jgi:hypothetical protein
MKMLAWILWLFPLYLLTQGQLTNFLKLATTGGSSSTSSSSSSSSVLSGALGGGP